MAKPSKIDRLPAELRELIGKLRRNGRTIREIREKLAELDVQVSMSGLGRYTRELDAIAEQIRFSHGVSEAIVERFGDAPESRTARVNIELMHSNIMRLLSAGQGKPVELEPQQAMFLATAMQRLASAAKADTDREIKIRERIEKETRRKAAEDAADAAQEGGLSEATVQKIRARILGIAE